MGVCRRGIVEMKLCNRQRWMKIKKMMQMMMMMVLMLLICVEVSACCLMPVQVMIVLYGFEVTLFGGFVRTAEDCTWYW